MSNRLSFLRALVGLVLAGGIGLGVYLLALRSVEPRADHHRPDHRPTTDRREIAF